MKKMMILVSAIMMAAAANAEEISLKPFDGVKVNVPARVRFVYGESYGIDVTAQDSLVSSAIKCSEKDGILYIHTRDEQQAEGLEGVCITIVSPKEPKLMVGRNLEVRSEKRNLSLKQMAQND